MTTALQLRRGTTAQHSSFTGANGEVTVDTDKKTIVVHDGATAGGVPLLPKTMTDGTANGVAYLNGSKVLTTGSALTFDGTSLIVNGSLQIPNNTGAFNITNASGVVRNVMYQDSSNLLHLISVDGAIGFYPNNSEQMRLTSTGLGIGTSSPSYKLQVVNSTAESFAVRYQQTSAANAIIGFQTPTDSTGYSVGCGSVGSDSFGVFAGGLKRMTLDASGNLGLGVTPSAWDVYKGSQVLYGALASSANAANNTLLTSNAYYNAGFKYMTSGATATAYQQANGVHQWLTTGTTTGTAGNAITFTQAMTLNDGGNLSVGTTSLASAGQVNGVTAGTVFATKGALTSHTTSTGIFEFQPGTNTTSIRSYGATAGTGAIAFNTGGGGGSADSERMRIDSSGNVGIGTSSPGAKLDVVGTGVLSVFRGNSVGASYIRVDDASSSPTYQAIFGVDSGGGNQYGFVGTLSNNPFTFRTNNTERMRIDSSGNLLVGVSSFSNGGGGVAVASGAAGENLKSSATATSAWGHYGFYNGNGRVGLISTSGTATTYATSSDYRLKENIQPMQNALGVVAQLNPVTYTWKADGSDGQGFIAHELQAVVPDCVTGEKDAVDSEGNPVYQGIDTSFLVATLTKAIQELKEQVDAQAAEIAQLKGN